MQRQGAHGLLSLVLLCGRQKLPVVPRNRWALPEGRGIEDGKPNLRRQSPFCKASAARGDPGVRRLYIETAAFSSNYEAAARKKSGGPMLKLALEGLKGRRSRKVCQSGYRDAGRTLPESDLFRMPQHLYPPSRMG